MTAAEQLTRIEALAEAMEGLRQQWEDVLLDFAGRKVADARAHAGRAVTQRLREARAGRPTLRIAKAHPSYQAAENRLQELLNRLVGHGQWSLDGKLRDHREAAYRTAHRGHKLILSEPDHAHLLTSPDAAPTAKAINHVRGAAIHGYDLRQEIEPKVTDASRRLHAVVHYAGMARTEDRHGEAALDAWETRTRDTIASAIVGALVDSTEYAHTEAGRDLIHPDYLES